jgi:hypothetical protein
MIGFPNVQKDGLLSESRSTHPDQITKALL